MGATQLILWWLRLEKDGSLTLFDVRVLGVWMAQSSATPLPRC